ncbi:MAG: helix-turn-helix transcriptional regulator [Clostridiaceae bacterium]|nr:helix-turn-helix transcriptional regulator [Clostridiaceae bacterium]
MLEQVGGKIKEIRKELKMTQSQLAGEELTKSMLSQIENNLSNPSMKTLQYIANRLNKSIAYFLEEKNIENNPRTSYDNLTADFEQTIKTINDNIEKSLFKQAQHLLEDLLIKGSIKNPSKLLEDIAYKLGKSLIEINNYDEGERYINLSIEWCLNNKHHIEAAKAYLELSRRFLDEYKYEECLNIINRTFEIYNKSINSDIPFEIELYFHKILVISSIVEGDKLIELIDEALSISNQSNMYYKTGELYRLKATANYLKGNYEEFDNAIKKAYQFAEFSEDKASLSNIHLTQSMVAIEKNDPEKALEHIELQYKYMGKKIYLYHLQKAKAHYLLGNYQEAYEYIQLVEFPSYTKVKLDYLIMWSSKIYEGLILNKLGRYTEALEAIKYGIEKMEFFDASSFLTNAYKFLAEVYSDRQDFENAFISLKKADAVQMKVSNFIKII